MDYAALVGAVHAADSPRQPAQLREAYNNLLSAWPLCYGYWKRFADFEVEQGSVERASEVYERALVLGSYCVEIWAHYGAHATAYWQRPEDVRALFERGASLVGSDYGADVFWDRYIAFETARAGADHRHRRRL